MAQQLINSNSTQPLGGPNTGTGTDQGDTWDVAAIKLNAMTTELYNRTGGTATQTNNLPSPWNNFRNAIDGGDFTTNPWQRGTSFTGIAATPIYTADRFFVVGGAASVSATASQVATTATPGFAYAFQVGRASNASSLSAITVGQIMEYGDSVRFQGQTVTLSFWAQASSNFTAANSQITAAIVQGTGSNQSAISAVNGGWTGQTNVFSTPQAISTTMTRYSFSGVVSSNTTELGFLLNFTPTGSASTSDFIQLQGIQFEVGSGPSNFEHRDMEVELALAQRFCFVVNEPVSNVIVGAAFAAATNRLTAMIPLPTPMRIAPTSVSVTAGSFVFQLSGAATAATGLVAGATHTVNMINLVASATVASNAASMLHGNGGSGSIVISCEY